MTHAKISQTIFVGQNIKIKFRSFAKLSVDERV